MKIYYTFLIVTALLILGCKNDKAYQDISSSSVMEGDGYVGNQNCTSCHQEAAKTWEGSHHDKAMQLVTDESVLGDFNDSEISIDGVSYFFFKKESDFYVRALELDGSDNEYKVAYVFGLTPLQQYIVDFPDGRKQVLRVTWDTLDHKWFHQYAGDEIVITDWLHWSRGAQNWNTMCAECHSTNLKKNYLVEKDSFHTTYSSINVSCESCHGPGAQHSSWADSGAKGENMHIVLGSDQQTQMNMCAPCHARRVKLTKNMIPALNFEDQYLIQNISSEYYHLDGQILEEDYVYGSFLQSKMHAQGVKCSDCHNVHSNELKMTGNKLCLQCHVPETYESPKHHFHKENTEASQCINCHMTGRYYMGNDFRRDHSFRIPRPDQSVSHGTPNACNECHKDKSEEWAAQQVVDWYGKDRRPHFSDYSLLSNDTNLNAQDRQKLNNFISDLSYPAIARSTVIANLRFDSENDIKSLLAALNDSTAIVRYNALMEFRNMNPQDRMSVAQKHMTDSTRLVRIGSAQLLIGFDGENWSEADKLSLFKVKEELEEMLFGNADFSTGRLQLGDYFMQTNDIKTAIKHYEIALKMDSLLFPVYTNLATAYSIAKEGDKALETLNTWMDKEPNASRPYYLRALLNFEIGNNGLAEQDLKMAIELNPQDSRSMYNLATYYYQTKDYTRAASMINKTLKIEPNNAEVKYLKALILKEMGRVQESNKIMQELQAQNPA